MSALKRFYNLIFGIKPEVNKKRRVSKPSEKPKAVYDLLNSVGNLPFINSARGKEFTGEWIKDKKEWQKFFNKNKEYLLTIKVLIEKDGYMPDEVFIPTGTGTQAYSTTTIEFKAPTILKKEDGGLLIVQAPSVEKEIKEKAEKDLGFEVNVNQESAGVYIVSRPNGLPKFDGPNLIIDSTTLEKQGLKFDPVIADEVGQSNKAFEEDVEHKGPIMFADDYIKQCKAKKDGGDLEIIQDPKFNTPEAQQKFVDAFNKNID